MNCNISPNLTIADGIQLWQFSPSLEKHVSCGISEYLRPDKGGSQLPWPYTIVWIVIHFPVVIIRVARWEKAQVLSLILAAVSVASCLQAYTSTQRKPEEVL